ncbi:MAG: MATE family efflux transporter [Traorella sp.]
MNKYFGDRKFNWTVLMVALPIMLQNLVTTSVNLVDSLMVGQLGDGAIGGVAAVNRYYMILNFGTMGFVSAVGIFIAQYYGAKNESKIKESFRISILASYLIIMPFFLVAFFFPEFILRFFTQDEIVIQIGIDYLRFACFTYLPLGLSMSYSSAMRCIGQAKYPLYVSVFSVFLNTFLNYCLIFGNFGFPCLGVVGAAIATLIARIIEALILLIISHIIQFPFNTNLSQLFQVDSSLTMQIIMKAAPLCLNEILWSAGNAMILRFYGTRGSHVLSGYSISQTSTDMFYTLFSGMAVATTVMVAHQLGANQLKKAKENGYHMIGFSFGVAIIFSCLMFLMNFAVPFLYSSASEKVIEISRSMICIQAFFFSFYTLYMQNYFIIRAGGDTKSTLIMDGVFMWCITIPTLMIIAYFTSLNIYIMFMIGQAIEVSKLFLSRYILKKEKWLVNLTNQN